MASLRYEKIKANFDKGWVTQVQLAKYVELGVITQAEADTISPPMP